ncbi:regulator of chromosome condensation 1/beta-lactamase-inhibitor protein II [Crassisporium funariophilum]|nr:regulator of chromosome condensation 1/beta-lactamase-inhibitor protein II [Crassisporium funariophilum]
MFKRAGNNLRPHLRRLHSHASSFTPTARGNGVALTVASAAAVAGTAIWYSKTKLVYNDAEEPTMAVSKDKVTSASRITLKPSDPNSLYSLVWGSNSNKTLSPDGPSTDPIRTPTVAGFLNDVALRDLQLHETHAACVDARGDVYQWGDGFYGKSAAGARTPKLTLRGKNIVQLQLTHGKVYALSASGKVYTLAADVLQQELRTGAPTPSSDSWWGTGWFWGEDETIDFAELHPAEKLGRKEFFVSIATGKSHLLALTSKGRVFAHPVNKNANQYGQLGFRKFSVPDPASTKMVSHLQVELVPKSLADPFSNSTRSARTTPTKSASDNLTNIDDSKIRFCPNLFEVPVLRDVDVAQIAAGGRSSFVRTTNGRVLGWGANEYGQIGLGSNVSLDTITVPTEVILWRMVPNKTSSKCLDVTAGGDLTAFTVLREGDKTPVTTDLLMSGNGQYGGLGNNTYSSGQGNPSRVKGISGLLQYNDRTESLDPIMPEEISISPTGHVLLALDSSSTSSDGVGGRDLMVWGKNYDSELGNGKKSSVAVPTSLETSDGARFMLMAKKCKVVNDLHGKKWKRNVKVEQRVVAGYGNSAVYWKIAA